MKKLRLNMKHLFKLVFSIAPIILFVPTISLKSTNNTNEDKEHEIIKKMFVPYYRRLGLEFDVKNNSYHSPTEYDKVGIIEVNTFETGNLIHKKNPYFKFTNLSSGEKKGKHPFAVSSIIGTDIGINKNAHIFFDTAINKTYVDAVKNMYNNYGVKLFNLSIGQPDLPELITEKYKNFISDDLEKIKEKDFNLEDENIFDEFNTLFKISLSFFYYIYNKNPKLQNTLSFNFYKENKELDDFAKKNNIKVIFSAGNENVLLNNIWKNLFKDSLDKGYIDSISFESISKWVDKFIKKAGLNSRIINSQTEKWYTKRVKNIILLNKVLKSNFLNKNIFISSEDFFNNDIRVKGIKSGIIKYQSTLSFSNLITVGAVNSLNIPLNFSSYSEMDYDNLPFISAYGENSEIQDESYIKYKIQVNKKKFLKNRSENSLNSNEKIELDKKIKEWTKEAISETRSSLYKEFKKYGDNNDEIEYLSKFAGTSMAAPLVTGMISLLQSQLNKDLTINEVKILLSASSNYSSTLAKKYSFSEDFYDSNFKEYWRKNNSKNKTGFGIPKYFKMKKIMKEKSLKGLGTSLLSNLDISSHSSNTEEIEIAPNFDNINVTVSATVKDKFINVSKKYKGNKIEEISKILNSHFEKESSIVEEKNEIISKKENAYIQNNEINILDSDIFSPGLTIDELNAKYSFREKEVNYFDLYTYLSMVKSIPESDLTINSERTKISISENSSVERVNFGHHDRVLSAKIFNKILFTDLNKLLSIIKKNLWEKNKLLLNNIKNKNEREKKRKEIKAEINSYKEVFYSFYKDYIRENWEFHWFINED
nr:S8 family serine peptidase [Mycoplasmopsis canis]WQQ12598.1 S8 family serine peptidase [Mycoplasmopsis canis]